MACFPHKPSVLVLGASGKLGRALQRIWQDSPPQGFGIKYVFRESRPEGDAVCWSPGDSTAALPEAQAIVALWGVTRGSDVDLQANTRLAAQTFDLAQAVGAGRVLHMSSAAVYPATDGPLNEDVSAAPPSPYGHAKAAMERYIQAQAPLFPDQTHCMLRIGNVAGAESLFANARPGATVTLDRFKDGSGPERSYIAPADLARVIETLLHAPDLPQVLNVAAPRPTAMADLARAAGAALVWRDAPDTALPRVHLDTTRLQALCPLPDTAADAAHLVAGARASGIWP